MIESLATQHPTTVSGTVLSSKILNQHLERFAIVYVRQSSTKQVEENIESTQLQYRLVDRAAALGWPRQRKAEKGSGVVLILLDYLFMRHE